MELWYNDIMPFKKRSNLSRSTITAKRNKLNRLRETSSEREIRLARSREHQKELLARETSAERSLRLAKQREYTASVRERNRSRNLYFKRKRLEQETVLRTKRPYSRRPRAGQAQRNALLVESLSNNSVVYTPTLWYYKHLNFLSGNNDPVSDESDSDHEEYVQRGQKRPASTSIDQNGEDTSVDPSAAAFGRSVGAQLHQLSKVQRCIAEKLISDVIYHAKMDQLSLETSINGQDVDVDAMIPEAGPSWYDKNAGRESPPRELTAEELVKKEIAETESAVSFLQMENNDTESYVFHDVEGEQNDTIDIIKQEII